MDESKSRELPIVKSPVFCALPWVHLCGSVDGVWGRCCVDSSMYYDDYYKMEKEPEFKLRPETLGCLPGSHYSIANPEKTLNLVEAFNSPAMRETRVAMMKGERVAACQYCYDREDGGGTSYRQIANQMFRDKVDWASLTENTAVDGSLNEFPCYLDIRFGNTCNLECIMCGFPISSRWGRRVPLKWMPAKIDPYASDHELWRMLEDNAPKLRRIYFAGGEPFLQPLHFKLIDMLIDRNCAAQIDLGYNTNLTILPRGIFEKLGKFKSVDIGASCDGTGKVFESIRVGAKWDTFIKNVRETKKHFPVRLAVTPQRDNIANLDELIRWGIEEGCEIDLTNILMHPAELSLTNLSDAEKKVFANKYTALALSYKQSGYQTIGESLVSIVRFLNTPNQSKASENCS
jgi:sulfatase maturation enzyme AslB (radical SAM superfamily)